MNIFTKIFNTKGIKLPAINNLVERTRFSLPNTQEDSTYLKEYKNWVYACVNARAEELGSIDLKLYRNDKEIEAHEVLTLLNDVNPNSTKYELFMATQAYLDLVGNAYWYLARDNEGQGKIRQIYLISPDKMTIALSKDNPLEVAGYVYGSGKEQVPFDKNEILHFKNFNPKGNYPNPHKGVGIVESALWAIETDNESRNWNYSFFKNSAKPDGILTTDSSLTDETFARIKQDWNQTYQGSNNRGKTAILENGLRWQDISKTQKDMDFVAQRTFSRDEILSIFRVPKTVVGITDDVNRANAEASDYVFAKRTIKPLMDKFVIFLNEYLLSEYKEKGLVFKYENPVPEDRAQTINEYSMGINKWLTRNDIRLAEGLPLSDNGDTFMGGFNEVEVDNVKRTKSVNETHSKGVIDKKVDDFIAKLPKKKSIKRISDTKKVMMKEIWEKRFDRNEKKLLEDTQKYFRKQEVEVLKNLNDTFKGLKSSEYKLKDLSDDLLDKNNAISSGISMITPHIAEFLKEGGEMAENITPRPLDMSTPEIIKFQEERAKFFAESVTTTTSDKLVKRVGELVSENADFNTIKDEVKKIYEEATDYRAELIARTEVSASLNEGSKQTYLQNGINKWEYIAVLDDRTADECAMNDGVVVEIGKTFPSGITQPPENHPNCRCFTGGVIEE